MSFLKALPPKKVLIPVIVGIVVIGIVAVAGYYFWTNRTPPDKTPPEISLTSPTSEEWYSTDKDKISIKGLAGDESGVKSINWEVGEGKSGSATVSDDTWNVEDIPLATGDNKITIKATDNKGNASEIVLNVVYNSDISFYDLTLSQDYIYKDDSSTQITARAGVETQKTDGIGSVYLYKVVKGENEKLTEMQDNGVVSNGDDIPGDSVFSGIESFSSTSSDAILLRVGATIGSSSSVSYSQVIKLTVLNKLSQEQISKMISTNKEINDKFKELKESKSPEDAAKELAEFVSEKEEITVAGTSENGYGVWWEFKGTGILGGVQNNPKDTKGPTDEQLVARRKALEKEELARRGGDQVKGLSISIPSPAMFGPSPAYAQAESNKLEVKSTKALYLGPFLSAFGNGDDYYGAWKVIKDSKCPECQTTEKKNKEVKVEDFKTLSNYGLIVVSSHGDTWFNGQFAASCNGNCPEGLQNRRGKVITYTDQQVNAYNLLTYLPDLLMQRLALDSANTLVVLPSYVKRYNGTFPNSLVYISTCRSFHNFSLAIAFLSKGAKAYYGYDEYVYVSYAKKAGQAMMESFINKGKTANESFKEAIAAAGTNDGGIPPAYFRFWGWSTVKMGGKDIQNPGFEERLVGWQAEGDARVINRLASLSPREGNKMAIISTGLGSVYDSNSALIQKICSKEGTATLSFKYNVVSEEPMEWVDTAYDDNFTMIVSINNKKTTLVRRAINNSSWRKIGGINFAGGDDTTYHTGWRTVSKDLGKVAPDDVIQIEFRVSDKGDSIYDTAALIDSINLTVK